MRMSIQFTLLLKLFGILLLIMHIYVLIHILMYMRASQFERRDHLKREECNNLEKKRKRLLQTLRFFTTALIQV